MMDAQTVEIPMQTLPDGRYFIADREVVESPLVAEFVGRFSNYWSHDDLRCGFVSPAPEVEKA